MEQIVLTVVLTLLLIIASSALTVLVFSLVDRYRTYAKAPEIGTQLWLRQGGRVYYTYLLEEDHDKQLWKIATPREVSGSLCVFPAKHCLVQFSTSKRIGFFLTEILSDSNTSQPYLRAPYKIRYRNPLEIPNELSNSELSRLR